MNSLACRYRFIYFFNFAVVFSSLHFRFRLLQQHYQAISVSIGDAHGTVQCASPSYIREGDGDGEEIRDSEGDRDCEGMGRRRLAKGRQRYSVSYRLCRARWQKWQGSAI